MSTQAKSGALEIFENKRPRLTGVAYLETIINPVGATTSSSGLEVYALDLIDPHYVSSAGAVRQVLVAARVLAYVETRNETRPLLDLVLVLGDGLVGLGLLVMVLSPFALPALALAALVAVPLALVMLVGGLFAALPFVVAGRLRRAAITRGER